MNKQYEEESRKPEEVTDDNKEEKDEKVTDNKEVENKHISIEEKFLNYMKLDEFEDDDEDKKTSKSHCVINTIAILFFIFALYCLGFATAYQKGTEQGYQVGCQVGREQGYQTGYDAGTSEDYDSGFHDGILVFGVYDLLLMEGDNIPEELIEEFTQRMYELLENPNHEDALELVDDIETILSELYGLPGTDDVPASEIWNL